MAWYKGTGIVWDSEKNKPLCKFTNGVFYTVDPYIKDKLDKAGFESNERDEYVIVEDVVEEIKQIEMSEEEIRSKAKELKIKSWHVKSIENLLQEIAEKEGE